MQRTTDGRRRSVPPSGRRWQAGQVLILFAILVPVLLVGVSLTVDLGNGSVQRRASQNFADASAMSGTQAIADNSPCGSGCGVQIYNADVYKAISDVITAAQASTVAIVTPSNVGSTLGTVYVVAQYLDANGNALSPAVYVDNSATPIPSNAFGLRTTITVTYHTFFAGIVYRPTVTVGATAAAVGQRIIPAGVAGLNPFAARWDPPNGANTAQAYDSATPATQGCTPPSYTGTGYECYDQTSGGSHPNVDPTDPKSLYAWNQRQQTTFILYGNGNTWQNANVGSPDNDWQSNSKNFKGFFNAGLTNNCFVGNQGHGDGVANGRAPTVNARGVGFFPLMDYASGSGSGFTALIYGIVPLYITSTNPLQGYLVDNVGSFKLEPGCGASKPDPTGRSPFIVPVLIS